MKRLIMLALLGISLATGSAMGADAAAQKAAVAPKATAVTAKTLTLDAKGRFHAVHTKKEKLDCDDCHGGGADDILFLRTGEFQGKEGPVNRKECLVCHQTPKKPTFYGTAK
jgi:hypothetical protein